MGEDGNTGQVLTLLYPNLISWTVHQNLGESSFLKASLSSSASRDYA